MDSMYLRVSATSSLSLCAIKAMKRALMVLVKTAQEFRNSLHLSQMVLFLNGNSGLWNWARYARLSTKDQWQNALMNSQSKYRTFCSKWVQTDGFAAQRDSVKYDAMKVVIQVDFAENVTTKTQIEIQSAYWAYNQVTLFTACAWEQGEHIQW